MDSLQLHGCYTACPGIRRLLNTILNTGAHQATGFWYTDGTRKNMSITG